LVDLGGGSPPVVKPFTTPQQSRQHDAKQDSSSWAVRHSDKLPIKGVYSHHSALKMLEIHKVFLRFLP